MWLPETDTAAVSNFPGKRRVSIYDVLGTGFTLLRVGETAPPGNEFYMTARKLFDTVQDRRPAPQAGNRPV